MKLHHLELGPCNVPNRGKVSAPPKGARIIDEGILVLGSKGAPSQGDETVGMVTQMRPEAYEHLLKLTPWLDAYSEWSGATARLSGIGYPSQFFGYVAPQPMRRRLAPALSSFSAKYPNVNRLLTHAAQLCWEQMKTYLPELAQEQESLAADIDPCWRIGSTPWTSGIINNTAPLNYHRDSGNVKGSWSAMITLRQGVAGGLLHLPELDSYLACDDMSIAIFNGQELMHGVTPLLPMGPRGKRYTIVFYAKSAFAGRVQPDEELKLAQAAATIEPSRNEVYECRRKEQRHNPLRFNIRAGTSDKKTVEEVIEGNGYQKPRKGFVIEPGDRWLDGGVNIGAFTCWAHRLGVHSVMGFEAEAENYEAAKQNLALNAVPFEIRHQAIMPDSHEGDTVTLYKCEELGKEWRHSTQWKRKKSTPVEVPAIRFSDALELSGADCVKLDIEGAEIPMLVEQSFPFDRIRKLAFEWSFDVERRIPILREVLDRVEASFPNVALSKKIDWTEETFKWFPPQVLVYAWR